jgi:membrane-bound serine protease (ClpP class)
LFKAVHVNSAEEKPGEPWELIKETGPERFLTVSGARARELGIAETLGETQADLAKEFHFEPGSVRQFKANWTDAVVYYLNTPLVTGILVVFGLVALYIEFSAPGVGIGGLTAGLCAALFFWSRFLGGTSTWLEVLLFAAGIIFIAVELFVIPGFGLPGLVGLALLLVSVVMASQDFVIPSTPRQWNQFTTTLLMILCSCAVFVIAAIVLARKLGSFPMFNQMILAPTAEPLIFEKELSSDPETGKPVVQQHPLVSVGDWGRAESLLRPAGRAVFGGSSVDVVSDGSFVDPGTQVRVIKIQGNMIMVAAIENGDNLADTVHPHADKT